MTDLLKFQEVRGACLFLGILVWPMCKRSGKERSVQQKLALNEWKCPPRGGGL